MECQECRAVNPDDNKFCGRCGAEVGRSLEQTIRKEGIRDRRAIEWEITQSVVKRLMTWAKWLGTVAAVLIALFGFVLGFLYHDARSAVEAGKTQIEATVTNGTTDINSKVGSALKNIAETTQIVESLRVQVKDLRTQIVGYKQVNNEMQKLREEFHGQTTDLSKLDLRVHSLETVPLAGQPSSVSFAHLGCGPAVLAKGSAIAICAQGAPPMVFQRTSVGELRPVSSVSNIGFQDSSVGLRPKCDLSTRGTFYVEKGNAADRPVLCVRETGERYNWVSLDTAPLQY
jgi:hypothetical protein